VEAEVESALRSFTRTMLEREPRSAAFLDEVRVRPGGRVPEMVPVLAPLEREEPVQPS
jgi:hypothetical protein